MSRRISLWTASEGSVENERGCDGLMVALLDNSTIIEAHGPTNGHIQDTTSYRTEVSRIIEIIAIYNMIISV
jgi:hypothetical protein